MILSVLGMHRSGTSTVARMLNLLGVDFGPNHRLLGPRADNPKGFWEHRDFVQVNIQILQTLGGNWRFLPSLPTGWERAADFEALRARARAVIARDFSGASLWGWKDPQTSLTLPFWQHILPQMHYVVCLRNPIDAALSFSKREKIPPEECLDQWLKYISSALQYTEEQPRLIIRYEQIMADWQPELAKLAQFLGRPGFDERPDIQKETRQFIDPNLYHFTFSDADAEAQGLTASSVQSARELYGCLSNWQGGEQSEVLELIRKAQNQVDPRVAHSQHAARIKKDQMLQRALEDLYALIPPSDSVTIIHDNEFAGNLVPERRNVPFLDQDGWYSGPPTDDDAAILELETLREAGVTYVVFFWPAFWWLWHYVKLNSYLRSSYLCVAENECLIVFRLSG